MKCTKEVFIVQLTKWRSRFYCFAQKIVTVIVFPADYWIMEEFNQKGIQFDYVYTR